MLKHFHYSTVGSTQDKAFELLDLKEDVPFWVSADECQALRGRQNRKWAFHPDSSVAVSLAFKMTTARMAGLSIACGYFVSQFLSNHELKIKWPNDLMKEDKKVGGILIESRIHQDQAVVVLGIGINQVSFEWESQNFFGINQKLEPEALVNFVYRSIAEFSDHGLNKYLDAINHRLWRKDEPVNFVEDQSVQSLIIKGVSQDGSLILQDSGRLVLKINGEIQYEEFY